MLAKELERQSRLREKAWSWPTGTAVEVQDAGRKVRGRLESAAEESFRLEDGSVWLFDEVRGLRRLDQRPRFSLWRLLAAMLLLSLTLGAADIPKDLKRLRPPSRLQLQLEDGSKVDGVLIRAEQDGVLIRVNEGPQLRQRVYEYGSIRSFQVQRPRRATGLKLAQGALLPLEICLAPVTIPLAVMFSLSMDKPVRQAGVAAGAK